MATVTSVIDDELTAMRTAATNIATKAKGKDVRSSIVSGINNAADAIENVMGAQPSYIDPETGDAEFVGNVTVGGNISSSGQISSSVGFFENGKILSTAEYVDIVSDCEKFTIAPTGWQNKGISSEGYITNDYNKGRTSPFITVGNGARYIEYCGATGYENYGYGVYIAQYTAYSFDRNHFIRRDVIYLSDQYFKVPIVDECKYYKILVITGADSMTDAEVADGRIKINVIRPNEAYRLRNELTGKISLIRPLFSSGFVDATTGNITEYSSVWLKSPKIFVYGHKYIKCTMPQIGYHASTGFAFYDENEDYISGIPFNVQTNNRYVVPEVISIPADAYYIVFTYWDENYLTPDYYRPFEAYFADEYETSIEWHARDNDEISNEAKHLGLHDIPGTMGAVNVVKRARQLTDILWTPAVDLPRMDQRPYYRSGVESVYWDIFKAGVTYKGIPYVRTSPNLDSQGQRIYPEGYPCLSYGFSHWVVGAEGKKFNAATLPETGGVSIETFITSAENPNSYFCTNYNTSNLSRYHHGVNYGITCTVFISVAYDLEKLLVAKQVKDARDSQGHLLFDEVVSVPIAGGTRAKTVSELYADGQTNMIHIGDLAINPNVHSSLITDIIRDEYGAIKFIEISEATTMGNSNENIQGGPFGGLCRRCMWSIEDYVQTFGTYSVYRYRNLQSVSYEPNPFVNVGEESEMIQKRSLMAMPYEGSAFRYKRRSVTGGYQIIKPDGHDGITFLINNNHTDPDIIPNPQSFYYDHLRVFSPSGSMIYDSIITSDTVSVILFLDDPLPPSKASLGKYTVQLQSVENAGTENELVNLASMKSYFYIVDE